MAVSNRVTQKLGLNEKCHSFQSAFLQFLQNRRNMASFNEIKFDKLLECLDNNEVVLVDVREPDELKEDGKIPGSINIPTGQLEDAFSLPPDLFENKYGVKMPDPESTDLVLSCKSGRRALTAYEKLSRFGYSNAQVYSGSFQDWVAKGGPLEKP